MVDYLEDKSTKEGILGSTNDTATRLEEWKDKLEKLEEQEHKPAA